MSRRTLRYGLVVGMTLVLALGLSSFTGVNTASAAKKFILAHQMPADHIFHPTSERFMKKLTELSGGKLEVEYHPGGDLGDWTALFEQAMRGSIAMTMTWGASEIDPRLDLSFLAYVVDNWKDAEKLFGPGGPMVDVNNDIFKDNNVVLLGVIPTDFGSVAIRKGIGRVPVNFPEDCKGIKMRVPPIPIGIQRFETWGFSPVPMPYAELYTALQLGTVDGRAFGPPVEIWQMRDVIETYILTRDYFEIAFWLANKKWWEKLSQDEQKAIRTAAEEATSWSWQEAQRLGQGYIDKVKEYGIKVVELTPEQLKKAKDMLYEKEWPWAEKKLGKDLVDKVRAAQKTAGIR